ncbi:MAG: hypothetical protein AB7O97_04630 [Planctomycetota bacterium]
MHRPFPLSVLLTALLLAALSPLPLPAQRSQADEFADRQDFTTSPPTSGAALRDILTFLGENGTYESLGPPFASPRPPLPQQLTYIYCWVRSGSYESSASPRCVKTWRDTLVWLHFFDGSQWMYHSESVQEHCDDGASSGFLHVAQNADAGPPGALDDLQRGDAYTAEDLQVSRRRTERARPGATVSFAASATRPIVGGGALEIAVGPGGALDLRQNAAAGGPLFATDGPALLFCDTVLLDPGVQLSDLFSPPPIVGFADLIVEENGVLPNYTAVPDPLPATAPFVLHNAGTVDDVMQVTWSSALGWIPPGQVQLPLPAGSVARHDLQLQVPPSAPPGALDLVTVQFTSVLDPTRGGTRTLRVVNDPPGVFRYGTGTAGCNGAHQVDADGAPTAGGPTTVLRCTGGAPGAPSLWMLGFDAPPAYGTLAAPGLPAFHVDPFGALFQTAFALADATGTTALPVQVPPDPQFRGLEVVAQALVGWTAPCPPLLAISSSPALAFAIQ